MVVNFELAIKSFIDKLFKADVVRDDVVSDVVRDDVASDVVRDDVISVEPLHAKHVDVCVELRTEHVYK